MITNQKKHSLKITKVREAVCKAVQTWITEFQGVQDIFLGKTWLYLRYN